MWSKRAASRANITRETLVYCWCFLVDWRERMRVEVGVLLLICCRFYNTRRAELHKQTRTRRSLDVNEANSTTVQPPVLSQPSLSQLTTSTAPHSFTHRYSTSSLTKLAHRLRPFLKRLDSIQDSKSFVSLIQLIFMSVSIKSYKYLF